MDGAVPSITYDSTPENHGVPSSNPGLATSIFSAQFMHLPERSRESLFHHGVWKKAGFLFVTFLLSLCYPRYI